MTWNILNRLPSEVHVVSAMRPPGRHTRASSFAAASGRLANITPQVDTIASKLAVVERQALGVAVHGTRIGSFSAAAWRSAASSRSGGDVHAGDDRAAARDDPRRPAGAGREIEDPLARPRVQPQHAVLDRVGDAAADVVVVAAAGAPNLGGP